MLRSAADRLEPTVSPPSRRAEDRESPHCSLEVSNRPHRFLDIRRFRRFVNRNGEPGLHRFSSIRIAGEV